MNALVNPADAVLSAALQVALAVPPEEDLAVVYEAQVRSPAADPLETPGISGRTRDRLRELAATQAVQHEVERCRRLGVDLCHWLEDGFPASLRDLPAPPPVLYLRGGGPWPPPSAVTIVGARRCTGLGRSFAREVGCEVGRRGSAVVSGMAKGIDQAAHEGCLAARGCTYGILACGVDRVYPPGARRLAEQVMDSGRLVSEMPVGAAPFKANFPRRNRLLAAWSRCTIVVEAGLCSGSLITARRALDLGRDVFAVPGSLDSVASRGTNRLIQQGAFPLLDCRDLDLVLPPPRSAAPAAPLLRLLAKPMAVAQLAAATGESPDEVLVQLVELELAHSIVNLGGGLYVRSTASGACSCDT